MKLINISFYNDVKQHNDNICIEYFNIDYGVWGRLIDCKTDIDVCNVLNGILDRCDCTKVYDCGRACMTHYPIYHNRLSEYFYYLLKLNNQILYNKYLDKFITQHRTNIIFEYCNPIIKENKTKHKKTKEKKVINKYYKQVTTDLFTNKETYIYTNPKTGDEIYSDNPNMLDELNNKKKSIKIKNTGVPISAMTFTFKKK